MWLSLQSKLIRISWKAFPLDGLPTSTISFPGAASSRTPAAEKMQFNAMIVNLLRKIPLHSSVVGKRHSSVGGEFKEIYWCSQSTCLRIVCKIYGRPLPQKLQRQKEIEIIYSILRRAIFHLLILLSSGDLFVMGWGIVFPFSSIFTTGEKIFHFRFNANILVAIRPFPQHVRSPTNSHVPLFSCSLLQDRCPFIHQFYILWFFPEIEISLCLHH